MWVYTGPRGPSWSSVFGSLHVHLTKYFVPASAFELAYWQLFQRLGSKHLFPLDEQDRLNLTLGPHGSYWIITKDGPLSHNLPRDLAAEIRAAGAPPCHVALGFDQTWICLWSDHSFSWNLRDRYPSLGAKLQEYTKTKDTVALVALNPYDDSGSWFMVDCDGLIFYHLKTQTGQDLDEIHRLTVAYMQQQAKRTGLPMTNTSTRGNGKVMKSVISPLTTLDQPAHLGLRRLLPFSHQFQDVKRYVPYRLRQPDVVASVTVGLSTAISCNIFGLRAQRALTAGAIAGMITFGSVSRNGFQ